MPRYHVYYMKPEFFRDGIMGVDWLKERKKVPSIDRIRDTHAYVKTIEVAELQDVFHAMQGEVWSPNGEAGGIIERAGLGHTSMSVGDIAIDSGGNAYIVDNVGFKALADLLAA